MCGQRLMRLCRITCGLVASSVAASGRPAIFLAPAFILVEPCGDLDGYWLRLCGCDCATTLALDRHPVDLERKIIRRKSSLAGHRRLRESFEPLVSRIRSALHFAARSERTSD